MCSWTARSSSIKEQRAAMTRISERDMELVLNPATPRDARREAFMRAMEQAWSEGWNACADEHRKAFAAYTGNPATSSRKET
jgi:hypothetical protein